MLTTSSSESNFGQIVCIDLHRLPELDYNFGFDLRRSNDINSNAVVVVNVHSPINSANAANSNNIVNNNSTTTSNDENDQYRRRCNHRRASIQEGDEIIEVSGISVKSLSLTEIEKLLRCCGSRVVVKVKRRRMDECIIADEHHPNSSEASTSDVDYAKRLANRLYTLDGFRAGDVGFELLRDSRFGNLVAIAFIENFDFKSMTLDCALRRFLLQFTLPGSVSDSDPIRHEHAIACRERILHLFAIRYIQCNPDEFKGSVDLCYMVTCSLLLLNTDLHGFLAHQPSLRHKKMSFNDFKRNLLQSINEWEQLDTDLLKNIYNSIRREPLTTLDPSSADVGSDQRQTSYLSGTIKHLKKRISVPLVVNTSPPPSEHISDSNRRIELSTWLWRKSTFEDNGKRTPAIRRKWIRLFCKIDDINLCFFKNTTSSPLDCVKLQHSLSRIVGTYKNRSNVFLLRLAGNCIAEDSRGQLCHYKRQGAEFMFQPSNDNEMNEWVYQLNLCAALFSSAPMAAPVSNVELVKPISNFIDLEEGIISFNSKSTNSPFEQRHWYANQLEALRHKQESIVREPKVINQLIEYEIRRFTTYIDCIDQFIRQNSDVPCPIDTTKGLCTVREDYPMTLTEEVDQQLNGNNHIPSPSTILKRDAVVVADPV